MKKLIVVLLIVICLLTPTQTTSAKIEMNDLNPGMQRLIKDNWGFIKNEYRERNSKFDYDCWKLIPNTKYYNLYYGSVNFVLSKNGLEINHPIIK